MPAGTGRIGQRELDLLVGADDEHRAHGGGVVVTRVDHPVQRRHAAVGVGDQREVDLGALRLGDVGRPGAVRLGRIDRDGGDLRVARRELVVQPRDGAQLGGAHRREVGGVREQHAPALAQPFMEADLAVGGLGGEVRRKIAQVQGHRGLLGRRGCGRRRGGRGAAHEVPLWLWLSLEGHGEECIELLRKGMPAAVPFDDGAMRLR